MNKYQRFAINHYLQEYDQEATFDKVIEDLLHNTGQSVPFEIYNASLSWEEIADEIIQMEADLEECLA